MRGEIEVLVLSDLKDEGFIMLDRLVGMDEEATLSCLERIAKFHATSVAYKEQFGDFPTTISRKIVHFNTSEHILNYNMRKAKAFHAAAKEWGLASEILDTIGKWGNDFKEKTIDVLDPDTSPEDFQVLCHGDLWLNNIMFSRDSSTGKDNEVMLVSNNKAKKFFHPRDN